MASKVRPKKIEASFKKASAIETQFSDVEIPSMQKAIVHEHFNAIHSFPEDKFSSDEIVLIERLLPGMDSIVESCIEDIWFRYDRSKSGMLSKRESKAMLRDVLHHLGETSYFSDEDFERAFREFDINRSESFEKAEVHSFLLRMVNLWAKCEIEILGFYLKFDWPELI